ncbi:MAG: aromatic ring-hydroxylating dioxygenase subunit alpha [Rhodospirillaceae bacterium]|nr:aromatic ring-hydroxylating dioxygenase subunit alpha [Rhodospirillaceae bacterium]
MKIDTTTGFLTNTWYVAAWEKEIGRTLLARRILDQPVVMFRTAAGEAVALEDRCAHRFLPLSRGELTEDGVVCGYHGMVYGADGRCTRIPGQTVIPSNACVRRYPLVERWGAAWIWMGDPALADPDRIIDVPHYSEDAWGINRGPMLHIRANYQLITDNLLDPAHVNYVHRTTLGAGGSPETPLTVDQAGNTIRATRHIPNSPAAPFFAKVGNFAGNVDRWQIYSLILPTIAVVDGGSVECDASKPAAERRSVQLYSYNFVTPETERSSFYFYFQLRNFAPQDAAVTELMNQQFGEAFNEDKVVLEDIQSMIDASRELPNLDLAIDGAGLRARRRLGRMIAEEREAAQARAS